MKTPKPRKTQIFPSKKIHGLFYEGFKKNGRARLDSDDQIIAFYYKGERFDLCEFVEIKPEYNCNFKKIDGHIMGRIMEILPDSEIGDQKLTLCIHDCRSKKKELFHVTEVRKERKRN